MEKEKEQKNIITGTSMAHRVLIEPWITEAATTAMEANKYMFKVDPAATKGQIKNSVEELYKVGVLAVNTVKIPRKHKSYGRTPGWKSGFKKAVVTVKSGDKIDFFEGV